MTSRSVVVLMFTVVVFAACVLGTWEGRKIAPAPAAGTVKPPVTAVVHR
jgi:hypothetical protein